MALPCRRCRQNLGRTTHALFHSASTQRLAIVATEASVLAALDLRSGSISWRQVRVGCGGRQEQARIDGERAPHPPRGAQVLPVGENVTALQTNGRALLSLSTTAGGAFVRLWSMQGALLWDALLPPAAGGAALPPPAAVFAGPGVVVAWSDSVTAFDYAAGDVAWCALAPHAPPGG